MSVGLLLDMAVSSDADRVAVVSGDVRLTTGQLDHLAGGGAGVIAASGCRHVVYVGTGGAILPLLIFSSARAGRSFTPINYRLSTDSIASLIERLPESLVVSDSRYRGAGSGTGPAVIDSDEFLAAAAMAHRVSEYPDPDAVAVVLFTSGTTSAPKAVELSHNNLTSYVTSSVEFGSAGPDDAALICVPPYHIAGVSAALSNLYAGRKIVYLNEFDADEWVRLVDDEAITTATVVPTMLDRIVAVLDAGDRRLPTLRNLAYGGSRVGLPLVRRALQLLPHVGFVNAYGLTETSSTVAVLTPEDHRAALKSDDPVVANRLGSVGRALPGIEFAVRDRNGEVLRPGEQGELYLRGEQVSGRYTGLDSALDSDGWFPTKDVATLDEEGYLFIYGRSDDTIIRGGENIAPAEIEDVLVEHQDVHDVAVVGVDDPQWGHAIVAVVVPEPGRSPDSEHLRDYVRQHLRGSRTPDRVVFIDQLPANAAGKVLRRQLAQDLQRTTVNS